ncbi:hypothetical protein ACWGI1_00190 [Streptomyces sp. NPDC054835]|uniref:hypothetical protein n=1 Tax=Streptomyces exfoliatus TaxID=1905 RepID=UPI0004ACF7E4
MDDTSIRIVRERGGEVEVTGAVDRLALDLLLRAGFLTQPTLRGQWIRLPFDMGESWENDRAQWAAAMLRAARYPVALDGGLNSTPVPSPTLRRAPSLRAAPPRRR